MSSLYKLNSTISNADYDYKYIQSVPYNAKCNITFHLADLSFDAANKKINKIFELANSIINYPYNGQLYEVLEQKRGSIVITVSSYLVLGLIGAKIIKSAYGVLCDMQILHAKTKKQVELIEKSKNNTALTEITNSIKLEPVDQKDILKLHSTLGKDYIISAILNFFL